jgi:predicted metal-binding membrane protein
MSATPAGSDPGSVGVRARSDRQSVLSMTAVLSAAALAWIAVVATWGDLGTMTGTMGLGFGAFLAMWTLMVAAMMLPSTAPMASLYARATRRHASRRGARLVLFLAGYCAVWATTGLVAWLAARLIDLLVSTSHGVGVLLAVITFATNGVYQLSDLKERCLAKCRMPLGMLLEYLSWRGRLCDLRVGAHHGAYCVACCWTIMALLATFGAMNRWAMAGLMTVIAAEKLAPFGPTFARATGLVSLALAVGVVWLPWLAPGLVHPEM